MPRKRIWSSKWQTKTKKKKQAIYSAWPWISNCWEWDPNSGLSGLESSALTTRPRCLGANLRRDVTSHVLFLNQPVLADFDDRRKNSHFKTPSLSGTSNNGPYCTWCPIPTGSGPLIYLTPKKIYPEIDWSLRESSKIHLYFSSPEENAN